MSSTQAPETDRSPSSREPANASSGPRGPIARLLASRRHRPMVLCLFAVFLHGLITVPKGETEAKPPPKRQSASSDVAAKQRQAKRSATKLRLLRKTWAGRGLNEEPRDERFAKRHEIILRRRVQASMRTHRSRGGDTDGMRDHYACRTVRCSVALCGQATAVTTILDSLESSHVERKPAFSIAQRLPYVEERPKPLKDGEKCEQLLLSFEKDVPIGGKLEGAGEKPSKAK